MAAEPSSELPIAVFDSGVGGLTVLHECLVSLPEEDYVYLGDDARFPYGARTNDELREHVEQVTRFLLDRGAKLLVIACNSAASAGQEVAREIAAEVGVEVVAVIKPEAEIAGALTAVRQRRRARDAGHGAERLLSARALGASTAR